MGGYVEDDHQLKTSLDHGMRFQKESNRFEYSKDAKKEDEVKNQSGESTTQRMARVCAWISSTRTSNSLLKVQKTKKMKDTRQQDHTPLLPEAN